MNAIYARQSVDRADSISIESQIEFCRYELKGEPYKVYADRGYSGKNTDRPAFGEMMRDMENGTIRRVVVYKLDRISRSILDFSRMMERFEANRVEFVSTTEKFDTSSPMGRAMLNICIVFAQLERETIQKRVADAYYSRSQKSLYMGGRVPYGFRLSPTTVDGVRTSMYAVNEEEAKQVRLIYELYAKPECSCGDIARCLQANGMLKNGKPWVRTRLAEILRNPVYVRADLAVYRFYRDRGTVIVNDPGDFIGTNGCYHYKGRKFAHAPPEGDYLVLAPHEGIIPADLWLKCRAKCAEGQQVRPRQKAKNTWLAGKIKCGVCGYALVDKHYPASGSRYLQCSGKMNSGDCKGGGTIYTDEIEGIIGDEIRQKLTQLGTLVKCKAKSVDSDLPEQNAQLAQVEREIAALLERLPEADGVLLRYIKQRIEELDGKKRELTERISRHQRREEGGTEIGDPSALWGMLGFDDKRQVVEHLIRVIRVTGDHVRIEWRI